MLKVYSYYLEQVSAEASKIPTGVKILGQLRDYAQRQLRAQG